MDCKSDGTFRSGDSLNLEVEALYVLRKKKMIHLLAGDKIFAKYRAAWSSLAAITKYSERSIPYLDIVG